MFHRVMNMPLIKLNKNLVGSNLFHKQYVVQSLQIPSTFKFSFIFKLLPCAETLSMTNSIHLSLIKTDSPRQLNTYDIKQQPFTCSNHHNTFRPTLCNFFGECEKIQSKLHSIIITLLQ